MSGHLTGFVSIVTTISFLMVTGASEKSMLFNYVLKPDSPCLFSICIWAKFDMLRKMCVIVGRQLFGDCCLLEHGFGISADLGWQQKREIVVCQVLPVPNVHMLFLFHFD